MTRDASRGGSLPAAGSRRSKLLHLLAFCAVYVGLELAMGLVANRGGFTALQAATASLAGRLLTLVGSGAAVTGTLLTSGGAKVEVTPACIPVSVLALTLALTTTALPASAASRVAWSALGLAAVLLGNVGRIAVLGWLSSAKSPLLQVVHTQVLPVALAIVGLAVWAGALAWEQRRG